MQKLLLRLDDLNVFAFISVCTFLRYCLLSVQGRNVTLLCAHPSIPWNFALQLALAPLKYSERSKKPSKSIADQSYAKTLLVRSKFFYPPFFVKMCQNLPRLSIRSPISLKQITLFVRNVIFTIFRINGRTIQHGTYLI